MTAAAEVRLYFNFRSPYCYVASKTLWQIVDRYRATLIWRPLGGWDGRSPPERAQVKIPLVRQDLRRICVRMGIPCVPPPTPTEPTAAGAVSLYAEESGRLREFVVAVMHAEWGEGKDIGDVRMLARIGADIGLDPDRLIAAASEAIYLNRLQANAEEAAAIGVFGVPSFVIGEEIFWGSDRIDYVLQHLESLGLARG